MVRGFPFRRSLPYLLFCLFLVSTSLLRDAGQGLNHMANNGLVHVDIKPDNLLVVKTADGLVGKMADYGHTRGEYRQAI